MNCLLYTSLAALIRPDTTLVSIMAVNNEIGSVQPIEAISELLADKPTISFHVDAVQALAKITTEKYLTERVDFATFSSHKFHGVRGVGFVYIKSGKKISPLLTGGGQERDYRSTTENVAGIAATAKALRLSMEKLDIFTSKMCIRDRRIETMTGVDNAKWTERGVLMDVTVKKKGGKTTIDTAKAHPTWVNRTPKGTFSPEGYPLYHYQTYILEDFIEGDVYKRQEEPR